MGPVSGQTLVWILVAAAVAALLVGLNAEHHRRREQQAALGRFVARHPGWHLQAWPCGVPVEQLAGRFDATPRGDRHHGVQAAVGGPTTVTIAGRQVTCQAACLVWFHEQRRRNRSSGPGRSVGTSYERRTELLVMCRLPAPARRAVTVRPATALGRVGLSRTGAQLESEAFNRRFHVDGEDPALVVTMLDAGLQSLLVAEYGGRGLELSDDLLVLSGEPTHRDRTLAGVVQAYPAILQDLTRLLRALSPSFWRTLGADLPTDADAGGPPPVPRPFTEDR